MTQKEWDKFIHGSQKDRFDKEIGELYHNAQTTEGKAIVSLIYSMVNKLLEKLEIERKENESTTQI